MKKKRKKKRPTHDSELNQVDKRTTSEFSHCSESHDRLCSIALLLLLFLPLPMMMIQAVPMIVLIHFYCTHTTGYYNTTTKETYLVLMQR